MKRPIWRLKPSKVTRKTVLVGIDGRPGDVRDKYSRYRPLEVGSFKSSDSQKRTLVKAINSLYEFKAI